MDNSVENMRACVIFSHKDISVIGTLNNLNIYLNTNPYNSAINREE